MTETLKPCPFCGVSNPAMQERYVKGIANKKHYRRECRVCRATFANWYKSVSNADEAWNRRAEPANRALSLAQLEKMNGEPVWCVDTKGNGIWALVHPRDGVCTDANFGDWEFYCYGWRDGDKLNENGWLAYRRKPEGGAR